MKTYPLYLSHNVIGAALFVSLSMPAWMPPWPYG